MELAVVEGRYMLAMCFMEHTQGLTLLEETSGFLRLERLQDFP